LVVARALNRANKIGKFAVVVQGSNAEEFKTQLFMIIDSLGEKTHPSSSYSTDIPLGLLWSKEISWRIAFFLTLILLRTFYLLSIVACTIFMVHGAISLAFFIITPTVQTIRSRFTDNAKSGTNLKRYLSVGCLKGPRFRNKFKRDISRLVV
jgi:hypothetical protein